MPEDRSVFYPAFLYNWKFQEENTMKKTNDFTEGSILLNRRLSVKRANVLFDYLSRYGELPDSLKTNVFLGRDWNGLIRLVSDD